MFDQPFLYNKHIGEFLSEFKNRFSPINYMGMPGKTGYSTKLNRTDINSVMNIFLPERFPLEPPIIFVNPKFNHENVDQSGRVYDDCIRLWNINSSLKNTTAILLAKFESKQNIKPNVPDSGINQIISNTQEDDQIAAELMKDLNSKSIEELILINFNQDDYIFEFTQKQRNNNIGLLQEVSALSDNAEKLKSEYEEIKTVINEYRFQYEEKEKELRELFNQKQILDGQFTIEKLIEEMKKNIEENYQKPRQKLINEFLSKKIDFETFKENFKQLSMGFHYYSLIKDKMNLYK